MAEYGWILLNRGIVENWVYKDKPFDRCHAWIDLLLLAEHTTKKKMWRGSLVDFKRGDVCLSIEKLSIRWGWSRGKVARFLNSLEVDGMIHQNVHRNRTTITIVNYSKFQDVRTSKRTSDKTSNDTSKQTSNDTSNSKYLKESIKNDKEVKESASAHLDFEDDYVSEEEWQRRLAEQDDDW